MKLQRFEIVQSDKTGSTRHRFCVWVHPINPAFNQRQIAGFVVWNYDLISYVFETESMQIISLQLMSDIQQLILDLNACKENKYLTINDF